MANFRARQLANIREAVDYGRQALRAADSRDPAVFAAAYIEACGPQIPGDTAPEAGAELGGRLRQAVSRGERHVADGDLQRELDRVHGEVAWVVAQADDQVAGLLLELPPGAEESPTAEALSHQSEGLGPGVFRKADIVILQPDCDGARFHPVTHHDIEC